MAKKTAQVQCLCEGSRVLADKCSKLSRERTKLKAALEAIDNMSACGPFAPDPRDLVRAMGERAQEALKKK